MRSKEVEEAINQLKEDVNIIIYGNKIFEDRTTCKKEDLKTVLAYIEELEKENKYLRDENNIYKNETVSKNKIRDKIELLKDIEQEFTDEQGYWGGQALLDKIEFLEDLLGE